MVFLKTLLIIYPKNDKQSMVIKVCSRPTKQVFLKLSQNSQENTPAGVPSNKKFAGFQPATLLNKRLQHRCFPVHFAKLNNTFLTKHLRPTRPMPKFQPTPPTPKVYGPTPPTPKSRPTPPTPFFDSRQFLLDPHYPRHPRYLADSPQIFVALQLPLYYLEQLHQPAIEN